MKCIVDFYRTDNFFPIDWLFPGFKMDREWDYTCYLHFKILLSFSALYSLFLIADAHFQLDIIITHIPFYFDKTIFLHSYRKFITPTSCILFCVFYAKLRLSIFDQGDSQGYSRVPYIKNRDYLIKAGRCQYLFLFASIFAMSMFAMLLPHLFPAYVAQYLGAQNDFGAIIAIHTVTMGILPLLSSSGLHAILLLEKTIFDFPELKRSVLEMSKTKAEDW